MLLVTLAAPNGSLVAISTAFMLKNQLRASPSEVALFSFLTWLPLYLSFLFGLARDRWNPFGLRDRAFLLIFGPLTALVFVVMAYLGLSLTGLYVGMLFAMVTFRFVFAAYSGLMALVAQEKLMSGRLASLFNVVSVIPGVGGAFASGWFVEHVSPRNTFLMAAALMCGIALMGAWKPRAVFEHTYAPAPRGAGLWHDIARLLKHRAIYPAVIITFLDQFMPGGTTPMQYYLTDRLHAPDEIYGYYTAIFLGSFIPMFLLYGWLCKCVPLEKLLWWGTILMIPQLVPLAFIHSGYQALILAAPLGLMGGIAGAAYTDLAMRSCPAGLQGTFMMLWGGFSALSAATSNVLGARIYSSSVQHGFLYDVIVSVVVFAAILPVLKFVPTDIAATSDGERRPGTSGQT